MLEMFCFIKEFITYQSTYFADSTFKTHFLEIYFQILIKFHWNVSAVFQLTHK